MPRLAASCDASSRRRGVHAEEGTRGGGSGTVATDRATNATSSIAKWSPLPENGPTSRIVTEVIDWPASKKPKDCTPPP